MIDTVTFGERITGVRYQLRPAAYAVIRDSDGQFGVVGGAMHHECHAWAVSRCIAEPARGS